jgi:hypothetical protein
LPTLVLIDELAEVLYIFEADLLLGGLFVSTDSVFIDGICIDDVNSVILCRVITCARTSDGTVGSTRRGIA